LGENRHFEIKNASIKLLQRRSSQQKKKRGVGGKGEGEYREVLLGRMAMDNTSSGGLGEGV